MGLNSQGLYYTILQKLVTDNDDLIAGLIWSSDVLLEDGRPMAIGLDTCLYHLLPFPKVLCAYNIQTNEVIYQNKV